MVRVAVKAMAKDRPGIETTRLGVEAYDRPIFIEAVLGHHVKAPAGNPARRRRWLGRGVVMMVMALAGVMGSALGAGSFTAEARFNAERLAAQAGEVELYGPAQVAGHPGAETLQRKDLIRQFIALDGVN